MPPMSFFQEIKFRTLFIWSIFLYNQYFLQCLALKWIYIPIPVFQTWQSLESPSSTAIDTWPHWVFCRKLNSKQFLFELFFILSVFLATFSPEINQLSHVRYFRYGNLWSPLALLVGEIGICSQGVFCRKLNSEQFLFKPSFNISGIFGSVQP